LIPSTVISLGVFAFAAATLKLIADKTTAATPAIWQNLNFMHI